MLARFMGGSLIVFSICLWVISLAPMSDVALSRGTQPLAGRLLILAAALAFSFLHALFVPHFARAARSRPRLLIDGDVLVVDDPALFRAPQWIHPAAIHMLCVGPGVRHWLPKPDIGERFRETQLSQFNDSPNLVLFFDRPRLLDQARGATRVDRFLRAEPPRASTSVIRLWARLSDAEAGYEALRTWHPRCRWVDEGSKPVDLGIAWRDVSTREAFDA